MVPDLSAAIAAEHRRDLLLAAERSRLASRAVPRGWLRLRWGRRLISLGMRISGDSNGHDRIHPLARKEVDRGTRLDLDNARAVRSPGG